MKEEEEAAIKIQAGYKGMQARKQVKQIRQNNEIETMSGKRYQKLELRTNYHADAEEAAIVIQAGFRGMRARQEIKSMKKDLPADIIEEEEEEGDGEEIEEEEEVVEGEDEGEASDEAEKEKAATKIQAGYRGMKTRKELKGKTAEGREDNDGGDPGEEMATEMMIEGAAQAAEDDEAGIRSQLDDGYISPENPTWKSSNHVPYSGPSSVCSSPTKQIDSSLSAAIAGNSLNLTLTGLSPGNGDDFDADDTPRSILIEEQDIFEGGYEMFKADAEDAKESMSHIDETDTEQTVIADLRACIGRDVEAAMEEFSDEEGENLTAENFSMSPRNLDEETDAAEIGAIPFELHPSYLDPVSDEDDDDVKKTTKKKNVDNDVDADESTFEFREEAAATKDQTCQSLKRSGLGLTLYCSPGSYSCEKVLMYLRERQISFELHEINLKTNQQVFLVIATLTL